jgi:hypothetical protein
MSNLHENIDREDDLTIIKKKYGSDHYPKPLVLFSIDISHWSSSLQSIVLIGGLIFFMCLYGYYQELVIYGWFNRQLSLFSTFLHFLGCSIFAQLQRNLQSPRNPSLSKGDGWTQFSMSMGTAPPRVAFFYYSLLVITKTAAQGMSNLCMTQINYPAKVLFKSANPIVTMIIGVCWLKKSYPLRDYAVVVLLVLGLYVFITGDLDSAPHSTGKGIFYVVLSMFGSAGVPMIQEHCIATYQATVEDLLYYCFLGSTLVSLVLSILNGEFSTGLAFLINSGSVHTWLIFIAFCSFGFLGANFSTAITAQYGALVNGICNTFRKAVTIALSFILFPERNEFTGQKLLGSLIFFAGLFVRVFMGHKKEYNHSASDSNNITEGDRYIEPIIPKEADEEEVEGYYSPRALQMNANMQMLALSESTEDLLEIEKSFPHSIHTEEVHRGIHQV